MKKLSIPEGPIVRNYKYQREYDKYRSKNPSGNCQFCTLAEDAPLEGSLIEEHPRFWVVTAKFPYYIWDGAKAGQHLLVVPKRHVDSIAHFDRAERADYIDVLAEWEARGFSLYARAPQSAKKSVVHQHTHLIEVGKTIKSQFYLAKPFINIAG